MLHRAGLVDRIAQHVHDAAQGTLADGYQNRAAGIGDTEAPGHTLGRTHGDGAHHAVTELLLHLQGKTLVVHGQCVIDLGHAFAGKLHIDDGADDLHDTSATHSLSSRNGCCCARRRQTAAAPLTISESSWVIAACRALL